jgi:hypothetical protein
MVPSSQSDEEELPQQHVFTSNKGETKISKLPTPHRDDEASDAMAVEGNHTPVPQDELDTEPWRPVQVTQMLTPPLSDLSSSPLTPIVTTVAKKSTQNIIDAIKARAYAKSLSSPESGQLDFQDDLDSSNDERLPILPLPVSKPRK